MGRLWSLIDSEPPIWDRPPAAGARFFFRGQLFHLLALVVLLPTAWALASPRLGAGAFMGLDDVAWFWLCVGGAVVHQVVVWLGWRAQLCWRALTRVAGPHALTLWNVVFFVLLLWRPVSIAALAAATVDTLSLPRWAALTLGVVALAPALYVFYSVMRYFGLARAAGGDHFRQSYRELPMVREGAFAWTPNAMYTLGFLALWAIALLGRSHAALVAALFQHAYIQVHYLATEQPDMGLLYPQGSEDSPDSPA